MSIVKCFSGAITPHKSKHATHIGTVDPLDVTCGECLESLDVWKQMRGGPMTHREALWWKARRGAASVTDSVFQSGGVVRLKIGGRTVFERKLP